MRHAILKSIVGCLAVLGCAQGAMAGEGVSTDANGKPVFLRISKNAAGVPQAMQTTVSQYKIESGEYKDRTIDLIGAVHIAHREYYQELNRRFATYDALLYELVADSGVEIPEGGKGASRSAVGGLQVMMKDMLGLQFQLEEIDYRAKNFVHADMSPTEFTKDMEKRGDGFLAMFSRLMGSGIALQSSPAHQGQDVKLLSALLSPNRPLALRQVMADQFESMEVQLAGLADKDGKSTLLTERNGKAFEILGQQIRLGKKRIAIFYGAGHLPNMDERLVRDFHAVRGDVEWLTAWDLVK